MADIKDIDSLKPLLDMDMLIARSFLPKEELHKIKVARKKIMKGVAPTNNELASITAAHLQIVHMSDDLKETIRVMEKHRSSMKVTMVFGWLVLAFVVISLGGTLVSLITGNQSLQIFLSWFVVGFQIICVSFMMWSRERVSRASLPKSIRILWWVAFVFLVADLSYNILRAFDFDLWGFIR